jgi:hypothetical protein
MKRTEDGMGRWRARRIACGLTLAVGLVGCQQTQVVPVAVEPRPQCDFNALVAQRGAPPTQPVLAPQVPGTMSEMPLNAVNITDVAITNKVMVQATTARRTPTGTVEVWARLVNCTDFTLQVEGRAHFLDEAQAPAEDVSAWNRVVLSARSFGVYRELSTNAARVRYYYVELREAK